ncbi:MAG TPA: dienelactone hydrolase family protein [Woeseiaceae bacterium]|nr:dienelactone hydrolase family protein [Woeseiaceae bacterium]
MAIQTRSIEYEDGGALLEGALAWDDAMAGPRPGVLVAHAWRGRSEFEDAKARSLAEVGYAGFGMDLYGKGVRGGSIEQNRALMQPFMEDRALLQRRMRVAWDCLQSQEEVDPSRTAAIGFCFGGLCVLDLARTGVDVRGVASFHGLLQPPGDTKDDIIRAKVLVLHGWDDPMAKPEELTALARELTIRHADWQIHAFGHTMHAFTNPQANDPGFGTVFQPDADRRSWQLVQTFLAEVLAL